MADNQSHPCARWVWLVRVQHNAEHEPSASLTHAKTRTFGSALCATNLNVLMAAPLPSLTCTRTCIRQSHPSSCRLMRAQLISARAAQLELSTPPREHAHSPVASGCQGAAHGLQGSYVLGQNACISLPTGAAQSSARVLRNVAPSPLAAHCASHWRASTLESARQPVLPCAYALDGMLHQGTTCQLARMGAHAARGCAHPCMACAARPACHLHDYEILHDNQTSCMQPPTPVTRGRCHAANQHC